MRKADYNNNNIKDTFLCPSLFQTHVLYAILEIFCCIFVKICLKGGTRVTNFFLQKFTKIVHFLHQILSVLGNERASLMFLHFLILFPFWPKVPAHDLNACKMPKNTRKCLNVFILPQKSRNRMMIPNNEHIRRKMMSFSNSIICL